MNYKLIDYHGQGFIVMGAHDYQHWCDNLSRRFDDSGDAGHFHLHVRVSGEDRTFASVEAYLAEFQVSDIDEAAARVLAKLFAVDTTAQHAWYGQHDMFQPFAGK
jgi:hypothetical protein